VLTQFTRLNHTNPSDQAAPTFLARNLSRPIPQLLQFGFKKMVGDDLEGVVYV
jgi:hypothetical protein